MQATSTTETTTHRRSDTDAHDMVRCTRKTLRTALTQVSDLLTVLEVEGGQDVPQLQKIAQTLRSTLYTLDSVPIEIDRAIETAERCAQRAVRQ